MWLQLDELLQPLPGGSRGENLRYTPIYDKIKEARLEDEDDLPQGEWQRDRKYADIAAVLKLGAAALTQQSKDLQLAVWLCEAAVRRGGFAALPECLQLLHQLQEKFWDILYPEMDEGSAEFRATPLEWFAGRCDHLLRRTALTRNGLNWLKYKESRAVGYESAVAEDKEKMARRAAAIADKKITAEEFDNDFKATPKSFYVESCSHLETAQEAAHVLETFCDQKYGQAAPNFTRLRGVLKDLKSALDTLLKRKREIEPDEVPQAAAPPSPAPETSVPSSAGGSDAAVVANAAVKNANAAPQSSISPEAEPEEVFAAIGRLAEHLLKKNPSSTVPYLLARAVRWGELRSSGDAPDPALLVAPSSELRQQLKRLHAEEEWSRLLAAAEGAMISPCGRAWLDLQRYSWQACDQLSQTAPAQAICSELRGLIADFPSLPKWKLTDDTPAASDATCEWLRQYVLPAPKEPEPLVAAPLPAAALSNGSGDEFEAAAKLARSGRMAEAMELLNSHASRENGGREKFLRQLKIAQLCLNNGYGAIAHPILQNLYDDIERRDLIAWEGTNFVVQLLTLLVQSIDKTSQDTQQRAQVYNLLCRLEPSVALQLQK